MDDDDDDVISNSTPLNGIKGRLTLSGKRECIFSFGPLLTDLSSILVQQATRLLQELMCKSREKN